MFVEYRVGVGVVRWPFALLDVFLSLREFERGLFDVHHLIDGRGARLATVLARAEARVNHLVCADVACTDCAARPTHIDDIAARTTTTTLLTTKLACK